MYVSNSFQNDYVDKKAPLHIMISRNRKRIRKRKQKGRSKLNKLSLITHQGFKGKNLSLGNFNCRFYRKVPFLLSI